MDSNTILIIEAIAFVVLLVFYVIAHLKQKRGEMVFTANAADVALILICPLVLFICALGDYTHPLYTWQIVCLVIAGVCFLGSVLMSIAYNRGNLGGMIISVLAKMFVIWLTTLILAIFLIILIIRLMLAIVSSSRYSGDTIVLKYDHWLGGYVGYRYY